MTKSKSLEIKMPMYITDLDAFYFWLHLIFFIVNPAMFSVSRATREALFTNLEQTIVQKIFFFFFGQTYTLIQILHFLLVKNQPINRYLTVKCMKLHVTASRLDVAMSLKHQWNLLFLLLVFNRNMLFEYIFIFFTSWGLTSHPK